MEKGLVSVAQKQAGRNAGVVSDSSGEEVTAPTKSGEECHLGQGLPKKIEGQETRRSA